MQGLFRGQKSFCSKFLINLIFVIAKYYFGEVWYYEKNVSQIYVRMKISVWVFCLFIFLNGWTDPVLNCVWYITWPKLRCVRVLLVRNLLDKKCRFLRILKIHRFKQKNPRKLQFLFGVRKFVHEQSSQIWLFCLSGDLSVCIQLTRNRLIFFGN